MKPGWRPVHTYLGYRTDVGCCGMTGIWTGYFSPTCSATKAMTFNIFGLLWSAMKCNSCGRDMTWSADTTVSDNFHCRCEKRVAGKKYCASASITLGSWFQQGNLILQEILLLIYDTVRRDKPSTIREEHSHGRHMVADCGMICRETILIILRLGF